MTIRTITIDLDSPMGKKLYWFLRELMHKYTTEIQEKRVDISKSTTNNNSLTHSEMKPQTAFESLFGYETEIIKRTCDNCVYFDSCPRPFDGAECEEWEAE